METATLHPTQVRLIETVSLMLDGTSPYEVLIESVLRESGVSRGSLYYHFGDFQALIERTLIIRFSRGVDETIEMMQHIASTSKSQDEFWTRMHEVTMYSQSAELAPRRAERARVIGMAGSNDRFRKLLAAEQDRLTGEIIEIIQAVQQHGWVRQEASPHAVALFIQAYTLGRALDDVSDNKVNPEEWASLIRLVTSTLKN
jgi:AcrR family transcriptional regulator